MPEVFVNYRTGDGEMAAATIDQELSRRFGEESSFRASRSIKPGAAYPEELLRNVRRSSLLLAVMGPEWTRFPELHDGDDWVRKEILEALEWGIPVVPVLVGRDTKRLAQADLPAELARLADLQSLRLDARNAPADLARIGDLAADMVPSLRAADRAARPSPETDTAPGSVRNSTGDVHGTAVQSRDIIGDVGTVVKNSSGPVHTGQGDIYHNSRHVSGGRHFHGDGTTYFEGDNQGGIHQHFGQSRRSGDGER
ncbi:toll/interleukin-1 receptor domain-containing protein [Streptomyces macrosporus]|uniref:TIR domain-containing protein n=1 Tax=Streptomyces macrosporus TaxID=44032 RepID=A0ABP5XK61_9ACTN